MQEAKNLYRKGNYQAAIERLRGLRNDGMITVELDMILIDTYLKGNFTDEVPHHMMLLVQTMFGMKKQKDFMNYFMFLKECAVGHAALSCLRDQKIFKRNPDIELPHIKSIVKKAVLKEELNDENLAKFYRQQKQILIFPIVWPVAFGDMTEVHRFIKLRKEENPEALIILIMPLNRKELASLAALNDAIDVIYDITLLPEEADRLKSLWLMRDRILNISWQERIIDRLLTNITDCNTNVTIEKLRYFPILDNWKYKAGIRIWEERARMWLEDKKELPKLANEDRATKNKIVVHFREGGYGDPARDMNSHQAQDLIDLLKENYPDYEIVRLGDASMTPLFNCVDLAMEEGVTLKRQIDEIQEAKLFIGSHSAPQMFAVAVSNTPIICTNYTCQETVETFGDNIPTKSYEPIGEQVKAILYTKMYDKGGKELEPMQNHPLRDRFEQPTNEEILEKVKEVLG